MCAHASHVRTVFYFADGVPHEWFDAVWALGPQRVGECDVYVCVCTCARVCMCLLTLTSQARVCSCLFCHPRSACAAASCRLDDCCVLALSLVGVRVVVKRLHSAQARVLSHARHTVIAHTLIARTRAGDDDEGFVATLIERNAHDTDTDDSDAQRTHVYDTVRAYMHSVNAVAANAAATPTISFTNADDTDDTNETVRSDAHAADSSDATLLLRRTARNMVGVLSCDCVYAWCAHMCVGCSLYCARVRSPASRWPQPRVRCATVRTV
jgi:hypothetical protein